MDEPKLVKWQHTCLVDCRLLAVGGPAVELVLDEPVPEALEVAVAVPGVPVGLKLLEGGQGQEHLLGDRPQLVVVHQHRLHAVTQVLERQPERSGEVKRKKNVKKWPIHRS